ncbi:methyltransferase domain-containing protein [Candidatus Thorarchaeota archaeon]|nr:MAG: methyltransferase domain-containing protein [Candidatus Thorarchaeota archaeon]
MENFQIQEGISVSESFKLDVFEGVYQPADDTYLLLDAITIESSDIVLDVGCGAGLGTLFAASKAERVVGTDISHLAVRNTLQNLRNNGLEQNVSIIQSDLFRGISNTAKFSMMMFNPPYLPADEMSTEMDHALVGGEEGSELTERFVNEASSHIIQGGRVYVVVSTLANIDTIIRTFNENSFQIEQVNETSLFFEKIQVLKGIFKGHKETVL